MATPEEIKKRQDELFSKMQDENYGEVPVLGEPKKPSMRIEAGIKDGSDGYWITRTSSSGEESREFVSESTDSDGNGVSALDNLQSKFPEHDLSYMGQSLPIPENALGNGEGQSRLYPKFHAEYDPTKNEVRGDWYIPTGPELGEYHSGTDVQKVGKAPAWADQSGEPNHSAKQDKQPKSENPTGEFLRNRYNAGTSREFLASRYGAGVGAQPGAFTHDGPQTSTAGRPQPPPASGKPSHPLPLLNNAPALPEPGDIDEPSGPELGQHPQEGKRRQNTTQADSIAESLDMATEQLLVVMDRMAQKLQSFSQRLVAIESIIDRTY